MTAHSLNPGVYNSHRSIWSLPLCSFLSVSFSFSLFGERDQSATASPHKNQKSDNPDKNNSQKHKKIINTIKKISRVLNNKIPSSFFVFFLFQLFPSHQTHTIPAPPFFHSKKVRIQLFSDWYQLVHLFFFFNFFRIFFGS